MSKERKWLPTANAKFGVVICNFDRGYPFLPLKLGDVVQILEENSGWYRGFSLRGKAKKGIFPASHIHLKKCDILNAGPREVVLPQEDPVVREIASALLEWNNSWRRLFMTGQTAEFEELVKHMTDLLDWRRQILTQSLTRDEMKELKLKITSKIDIVNKQLHLDLIPREENGEIVNPKDVSIVHLFKVIKNQEVSKSARSTGGSLVQSLKSPSTSFNIWLKLDLLKLQLKNPVEVIFFLYDKKTGREVSEPYREVLSEKGLPNDVEKIGCTFAVFTDLDQTDRNTKELYLVCRVIRLCNEIENKKSCSIVRRPLGIAVYSLQEILSSIYDELEDGKNFHMEIYSSATQYANDFAKLQDYVIAGDRTNFLPPPEKGNGLFGSLKCMYGSLEKVQEEYPLKIRKNTAICRKLGFSDTIAKSGEDRHDIFIELVSGYFDKGPKKSNKNVEIHICVVDKTGRVIENLVSCGQGTETIGMYRTVMFYHTAQCQFVDTVRVSVPANHMDQYSVRFIFGHMSAGNRPRYDQHAVAFLKLVTKEGTAIPDGIHELNLFPDAVLTKDYLKEPWEVGDGQPSLPLVLKDSFKVRTVICSTDLTQNVDLLRLLRWSNHKHHLKQVMLGVKNIPGDELLKFLKVSLDAVFDIVEDGSDDSILAFQSLVFVLSTVLERRYAQYKFLLDQFLENSFERPQVYQRLMEKLKVAFHEVIIPTKQRILEDDTLVKTMKAAEYLVKFIVHSRKQYDENTRGKGRDVFNKELRNMLTTFFEMIKYSFPQDDHVAPRCQALALQFFPTTLGDFLTVVSRQLLSEIIADFLFKLNPQRLSGFKTTFLQSLVASELFKLRESRLTLLPAFLLQLNHHIAGMDDQFRLCLDVLQDVISVIYQQDTSTADKEVQLFVSKSLPVLYQSYKQIKYEIEQQADGQKSPFRLASVVVCQLGILQIMRKTHYKWCIGIDEGQTISSGQNFANFINQSFFIFHDMTDRKTLFPSEWSVMLLLMNNILMTSTEQLMELISSDMLGSGDSQGSVSFEHSLWNNFFLYSVSFSVQEALQLEQFSEAKRIRILDWCGDMRVKMNDLMVTYWRQLGILRVRFIPAMVGPFLRVSLLPQPALRQRTIPLFYDMMEVKVKDGFQDLQVEMIEKLDTYVIQGMGDIEFKKSLKDVLNRKCKDNSQVISQGGMDFVSTLVKLLDRLFDFRNVTDNTGEASQDLKMHVMYNLLNFYKEMGRKEMYIRYIYRLTEMHKSAGSYNEAAFTLLLHAQLLEWSNELMGAEGQYPAQTCAERKEALYKDIIDLFSKGKLWEVGIEQCKELIKHHESTSYNYQRLAELYLTVSKYYDKILTEVRADSQYFRVSFYGAFPPYFKDRTFIFRGLEYEKLTSFNERLSRIFPRAKYMTSLTQPGAEIRNSLQQHIQSCTVMPLSDGLDKLPNKSVNETVIQFYRSNNVREFILKRPFHKGKKDKENEFVTLFIECTVHHTTEAFPGVMRWFEVSKTDSYELNPVQNGIETVKENISVLQTLIRRFNNESGGSCNPLTMKLQGIIDAAVAGGLKNYNTFFSEAYRKANPDCWQQTEELKSHMIALCKVCGEALKLHSQVCSDNMRGLHEHMEKKYREFRKQYGNPDDEDPYEPLKPKPGAADPPPPQLPADRPTSRHSGNVSSRPQSMVEDQFQGEPVSVPPPVPKKQRPTIRDRAQSSISPTVYHQNSMPETHSLGSISSSMQTQRQNSITAPSSKELNGAPPISNQKMEIVEQIEEDDTDL